MHAFLGGPKIICGDTGPLAPYSYSTCFPAGIIVYRIAIQGIRCMATSKLEVIICTYLSKQPWKEPLTELLNRNGLSDKINVLEYNRGSMPDEKGKFNKESMIDWLLDKIRWS